MKKPGIEIPGIEVIAAELETPRIAGDTLLAQIDGLKRRYDEPWRRHHDFQHPLELFAILLKFKEEMDDPNAVGWTIMYHDSIYDPEAEPGRNEELSARLAEAETPAFLATKAVNKVAGITRATAGHTPVDLGRDCELFLDGDLAILGAPPERYERYALDIREEYGHVPTEIYVPARIDILGKLASRHEDTGVYTTEPFQAEFEEQAQINIAGEIEELQALLP
jgi:predicted metal-dependent HD superfamily phosphohydrolase